MENKYKIPSIKTLFLFLILSLGVFLTPQVSANVQCQSIPRTLGADYNAICGHFGLGGAQSGMQAVDGPNCNDGSGASVMIYCQSGTIYSGAGGGGGGPQPGVCGSSHGGTFSNQPTSNLCNEGTASSVVGSGPYYWTCEGTGGADDALCQASGAGGLYSTASDSRLCGSTLYSCYIDGGEALGQYIKDQGGFGNPVVNGTNLGGIHNMVGVPITHGWYFSYLYGKTRDMRFDNAPDLFCRITWLSGGLTGNPFYFTDIETFHANWGIEIVGNCPPQPVDGVCSGTGPQTSPLSTGSCSAGNVISFNGTTVGNTTNYTWTCQGENLGGNDSCSASYTAPIGVCGPAAHNNYTPGYTTASTGDACSVGTMGGNRSFSDPSGSASWTCYTPGYQSSTSVTCTAQKAPVNGACGPAESGPVNGFYSNTASSANNGDPCGAYNTLVGGSINFGGGTTASWQCRGNYDGTTVNCSATKDTTRPICGVSINRTPNALGWYRNVPLWVTPTCDDAGGSGCDPASLTAQRVILNTSGIYNGSFTVTDRAGNVSANSCTYSISLDRDAPTCSVVYTDAISGVSVDPSTWTNRAILATATCSDTGGSGCATGVQTRVLSSNSSYTFSVTDHAGNTGTCGAQANVDQDPPTCSVSPNPVPWTNGNILFSVGTTNDTGGSGVDQIWAEHPRPSGTLANSQIITQHNGVATFYIYDRAGNQGTCSRTARIDRVPPICGTSRYFASGPSNGSPYSGTWTNQNVRIQATCSDPTEPGSGSSGCDTTHLATQTVTHATTTPVTGWTNTSFNVRDQVSVNGPLYSNNTCTATVYIDKTTPSISLVGNGNRNGSAFTLSSGGSHDDNRSASMVTITSRVMAPLGPSPDYLNYAQTTQAGVLSASQGVNVNQTHYYTDNGTYSISAYAYDQAGNQSPSQTLNFKIDTTNPSVTPSLTLNSPSLWYNAASLSGGIVFNVRDQTGSTNANEETGLASFQTWVNGTTVATTGFTPTTNTATIGVTLPWSSLNATIQQRAGNTIRVRVVDRVGHETDITYTINYDNTVPTLSFNDTNQNWRNTDVTANTTPVDPTVNSVDGNVSGVALPNGVRYIVRTGVHNAATAPTQGDVCTSSYTTPPTITNLLTVYGLTATDGTYSVYACAVDRAGNRSTIVSQTYRVDKTNPLVSSSVVSNPTSWVTNPLTLTLSTSDPGTVGTTAAGINPSGTNLGTTPYSRHIFAYAAAGSVTDASCRANTGSGFTNGTLRTISTSGRYALALCNQDGASSNLLAFNSPGNMGSGSYIYQIDLNDPTGTLAYTPSLKAGSSNLNLSLSVWDDDDTLGSTAIRYGQNHDVDYTITITGPLQTLSGGVLPGQGGGDGGGNDGCIGPICDIKTPGDGDECGKTGCEDVPGPKLPGDGEIMKLGEENGLAGLEDGGKRVIGGRNGLSYTGTVVGNPKTFTKTGSAQNHTTPREAFSLTGAGLYSISVTLTDKAGRRSTLDPHVVTIYPNAVSQANSSVALDTSSPLDGSLFADGSGAYTYNITLRDEFNNYVWGKRVSSVGQKCIAGPCSKVLSTNMTGSGGIPAGGGSEALRLTQPSSVTNPSGQATFTLASLTPGEFTQSFGMGVPTWDDTYVNTLATSNIHLAAGGNNAFRKPFVGRIDVMVPDDQRILLGSSTKYQLTTPTSTGMTNTGAFSPRIISGFGTGNIQASVGNSHKLVGVQLDLPNHAFDATIISASGASKLETASIGVTIRPHVVVSYTLSGQTISYLLTPTDHDYPALNNVSKNDTTEFLGLQVIGSLQGQGRSNFTGQKENFSDLSASEMRHQIRRDAYLHINSIKEKTQGTCQTEKCSGSEYATYGFEKGPGTLSDLQKIPVINGVKYIDGARFRDGVKLSEIIGGADQNGKTSGGRDAPLYGVDRGLEEKRDEYISTIILKDTNLIIDRDLNDDETLGIIVLKDGYNVEKDYLGAGNVYVSADVRIIKAIIYADGGLISVRDPIRHPGNTHTPFIQDTAERTRDLNEQLILKGSLFSRNTVGGAIQDTLFSLPGDTKTTDFDKAMIYDLNYVRRGKDQCLEPTGTGRSANGSNCKYASGAFIVEYDPIIQTNPPKIFAK